MVIYFGRDLWQIAHRYGLTDTPLDVVERTKGGFSVSLELSKAIGMVEIRMGLKIDLLNAFEIVGQAKMQNELEALLAMLEVGAM